MPPRGKRNYKKNGKRKPRVVTKYIRPRLPLNGQQNSEKVRLRYVETISLSSTAAQVYNFRANSCYDPNKSGVGHQPMGYDQLAMQYNHYRVLGARIKVSPVITGDSANEGDQPAYVMVKLSDNDSHDVVSTEQMLESRHYSKTKKMIVSNYQNYMSNTDTKTLTAYYSPTKFYGLSKQAFYAQDKNQAIVNTNPVEDAIFQVYAYPVIGGQKDPITLLVEIDFTVQFSEPLDLPQST